MPGNGKYTPELAQQIADLVAKGTPAKYAAQACGIGEQTFYDWLNDKPDFRDLVQKTRAAAIVDRISRIEQASRKEQHWTAAAWWLERQHPEEFGVKPERKDVHVTVEIRDCTADNALVNSAPEPKSLPYIEIEAEKVD